MPRRRGATNQSAIGRRTTIEDGRCNGNKKTTALPARSTRIAKEAASTDSPSSVQSVNESAGPEAASSHSQSSSDLGYLHKKFKKVAAAFATTPEPAPLVTPESIQLLPAQATATATATEEDPAPITEPSKKEEDCSSSNNNSSSSSSSSNGTLSKSTKSGGRYVCPYCQHACAKPSVLEKHIRAHTNERPYPCVPCGFAFKTKSNLYKHCKSRTHVLKVEETGGTASAIGTHIDPAEAGSDDTSDDNAMLDDSDDGEPMVVVSSSSTVQQQQQQQQSTCVQQQSTSASSTPEKFKTPYKPKFHNLKNADDPPTSSSSSSVPAAAAAATESTSAEVVASVTDGANRPSPGFLHERISQIISKNQAIVETLDPIWPRRYVRQSSRDNSKETAVTNVKNPAVPCPSTSSSSSNKLKIVARERSCSLTVISSQESMMMNEQIVAATIPSAMAPSTLRVLQESADESQRKRSYSEGPSLTDNQLSHSVRNLLHQPTKPARTDVVNAQNPEGSIIKDILLKSRGLLPDSGKEVDPPAPAAPVAKIMSSSFTVSALLNPSTTRAGHKPATISESTTTTTTTASMMEHDDPSVAIHDRPPLKRAKMSPSEAGSAFSRPDPEIRPTAISYNSNRQEMERMRTSLPLFGGEVEIHDGSQRTVMRIDPAGYSESNRLNGAETPVVIVTKANLNSGGGIVRIQPQESRLSVFPVIKSGAGFETTSCKSSAVPYIPGIPGPYSSSGWLPSGASTSVSYSLTSTFSSSSSVLVASTTTSSSCRLSVPSIAVHPPAAHPPAPTEERTDSGFDDEDPSHSTPSAAGGGGGGGTKFLRPNSLSLQPGTFSLKKSNMAGLDPHSGQPNMLCVSGAGMTLISPETPRPRKLFRQLYLNGHAYTYLGLKCSTRVYFCCLSRAQPMYVPHHPKLSMYSQWKTRAPAGLEASSPVQTMSLYDSRQRPSATTTAQSSADHGRMILTHSSYWTNRDRPTTTHLKLEVEPIPVAQTNTPSPSLNCRMMMEDIQPRVVVTQVVDPPAPTTTTTTTSTTTTIQPPTSQPKRVRIFAGGYKSTEEYTYVRGRGRGRYVCEECGIRCKKPSMLKKHIRTHTDLRPYTCRQCNFSFKTKGNLTKHMKSKAHHKKCTELGIVPVPTTVDEANIDEDSLARQETLKKMKMAGGSGNEGMDSDLDDDDEDEDDEEEDEEVEGEEEEDETEEDPPPATKLTAGQFEDAAEPIRGEREQEVARSLLDLGVMAPAGCKPTTYPYATHFHQSVAGEPDDLLPPVHSVDLAEMKEEPSPVVQSKPHPQPMDLSTSPPSSSSSSSCSSAISTTTATSTLLASIYSSPVSYGETRRPLSPEGSVQPATSGMLQAYLTEKALKEGLMKRHQVKLTTTTPSLVHPVVTFFPATTTNSTTHKSIRPEFVVPLSSTSSLATTSSSTSGYKLTDDGKTACSICNKVFTKPSQLRLHINIHYFERPFRCEACAVSFRTKGHLQKHKRSVTHFNKVNMNLTFGTPSTENPRPFKCSDCMIAFRIHGHLAKHLRSKMHIMKLECLGKLPFGTYAEMERSGINLNEIDTTDCHNSLESLQSLAHRLYKQDPSKIQQWQQEAQVAAEASLRERTISGSSEEFSDVADDGDELDEDGEDSDGLPDGAVVVDEAPPPPRKMETTITENVGAIHRAEVPSRALSPPPVDVRRPPAAPAAAPPAMYCSACGESCASMEAFQMHVMEKHRPPSPPPRTSVKSPPPPTESPAKLAPPSTPDVGRVVNLAPESRRSPPFRQMEAKTNPGWNRADLQYPTQPRGFYHPATSAPPLSGANNMWPPRQPTFGELMSLNQLPAIPPQWHQDPAAMAWIASRHMMLPMAGHPQHPQHNYTLPHGHAHTANGGLQPRLYSPTSSSSGNPLTTNEDPVFPCELCGKSFTAKETLRQHMVAHAQPRPFVCEFCDAGFTTQKQLESHLVLHRPRTS